MPRWGVQRPVLTAQACFLLLGVSCLIVSLAAINALSLEWIVVGTFIVVLLTVELGAPWYDGPWWRTRAGLVVFAGFVLYLIVLSGAVYR